MPDGHPSLHPHSLPRVTLRFLLLSVCLLTVLAPLPAQFRYSPDAFRPGEVLTYKVKWSFIRLGTITVRQELTDPGFPQYFQVWLNGESAVGLPFIDVFFRSTSLLDRNDPTNILYELMVDREDRVRTAYIYDPANARAFAVGTQGGDVTRLDTLPAPIPYYDGPGLYMFARCASGSDTTVLLPTVMDYAMGHTSIRFLAGTEIIEVPAFDQELPAHPFLGSTSWEGSAFAGMAGAFKGWVSTDPSRILFRAEVKIFLGSAIIELESASLQ